MKNFYLLALAFCLFPLSICASDDTKFSIHIIDYSLSWTSSTHYTFNETDLYIAEIDNIDKKKPKVLVKRSLSDKEKEVISKYLTIMWQIPFNKEYVDRSGGERNQKRINLELNGENKSIFVVNTFQQDIASFVTFLNSFIPKDIRMKEFTDPSKPIQTIRSQIKQ